jgi:transposase InsO family protein
MAVIIQPDALQCQFNQAGWVTDITYLIYHQQRAYLSTILDLQSRDIIAFVISHRNDKKLVLDTLNQAVDKKKDLNGLILHSDQGFQYTTYEYLKVCTAQGLLVSHSRKANPLDNSIIENFHSLLKKEVLYNHDFTSLEKVIHAVSDWMTFYNTSRLRLKK